VLEQELFVTGDVEDACSGIRHLLACAEAETDLAAASTSSQSTPGELITVPSTLLAYALISNNLDKKVFILHLPRSLTPFALVGFGVGFGL